MLPQHDKHNIFKITMQSDINVTPLVDVCLVLLIIFMVVTPMLQKGVDVVLPETNRPTKMPENERQLEISVKQDGTVFINQKWVVDEALPDTLKGIHENNPDRTVVLKGDRRLKYKRVRQVMRLINEAGFGRVGLVVDRKGAESA